MNVKDTDVIYTDSKVPIKSGKRLGLGYIIAAMFFLFNPNITVIDIFPDIIGYALIVVGLSKLVFINDAFDEASSRFKKMMIVSCAKFAAILLLFGLFDERERPYAFLLFSFTFLVLELIYLIPAFKSMFEGFTYLAGRYKSTVAYSRRPAKNFLNGMDLEGCSDGKKDKLLEKQARLDRLAERRKTYIEKIYRFTMVFVIIKTLGYALPEFVVLTKDTYTDNSFIMYMYDFLPHYRVLAFTIVLIVGIVWLSRTALFFSKLGKEKEFISNLKELFAEKAVKREGVLIRRAIKSVLLLVGAAAVFAVDFHASLTLDAITSTNISINSITVNVIPDVISAAILVIAAYFARNYVKSYKKLAIGASVYFGVSAMRSILALVFLFEFGSHSAVNHSNEAAALFYVNCGAGILESIVFLVTVWIFIIFMKDIIKNHTGYVSENIDRTSKSWLEGIHRELFLKLWVAFGIAVLSAISSATYTFMLVERHLFSQVFWVIDFVIQGAFAVSVISALFAVNDELENRYMLS